jgi:hypothetical protein
VKKAWGAQRDFLVMASKCKKPDQTALLSKLAPVQACMKVSHIDCALPCGEGAIATLILFHFLQHPDL